MLRHIAHEQTHSQATAYDPDRDISREGLQVSRGVEKCILD